MPQLTHGDLIELLEHRAIPGSYQDLKVLSAWIEEIIDTKGKTYVKRNRKRILKNWNEILEFGLTKI